MKDRSIHSKRYSPDVALFLVLIPFISAFNYYLTYSGIKLSWFLLLTFTIDTVQGYLAWAGVRWFLLFLDDRIPFQEKFVKRIIIQLVGTIIIGLSIIASLTELVSWIVKGEAAPLNFYTIDLIIISIWFFVINGIYIGLYYYNLWRESEEMRIKDTQSKPEGLFVKQGKRDILLSFDDVTGFYVDGDYAVACDRAGKRYYMGQSLDKIEKIIPASIFFRLNRQFILHHKMISGFSRGENGKILVATHPQESFPTEILISRTKAPSFKSWFRPEA